MTNRWLLPGGPTRRACRLTIIRWHVQRLSKGINAWIAGSAGTAARSVLYTVNINGIQTPQTLRGDESWEKKASSCKPQAPSSASFKQEASSPKQQASSFKPQAASSMIREPRNMWTSFEDLGPRLSAMMNVFFGCVLWKAIWCGENLSLLPRVTFNSTVKNVP